MLSPRDYHTPILELYQKTDLRVFYMYSERNYDLIELEMGNILGNQQYDLLWYAEGVWYGVTPQHNKRKIAYLNCPEKMQLPFVKLIELIDFQYHVLKTSRGNHTNTYETVYISSHLSLEELFPRKNHKFLNNLSHWISVIEY